MQEAAAVLLLVGMSACLHTDAADLLQAVCWVDMSACPSDASQSCLPNKLLAASLQHPRAPPWPNAHIANHTDVSASIRPVPDGARRAVVLQYWGAFLQSSLCLITGQQS